MEIPFYTNRQTDSLTGWRKRSRQAGEGLWVITISSYSLDPTGSVIRYIKMSVWGWREQTLRDFQQFFYFFLCQPSCLALWAAHCSAFLKKKKCFFFFVCSFLLYFSAFLLLVFIIIPLVIPLANRGTFPCPLAGESNLYSVPVFLLFVLPLVPFRPPRLPSYINTWYMMPG